jgi:hypothetical protein
MQNFKKMLFIIACFTVTTTRATAQQDSTGLPGDNFSLQGALDMFKQASSPEEFEKLINSKGKNVNNLDLNGDGEIDYIKVIDQSKNDLHAFVLQVAVSETENQDIAVIELEKTGDTTAVVQIVGDEDIFGEQVIVEASGEGDEVMDSKSGTGGPTIADYEGNRIVVNVFFWPSVRFVYRPAYVPWVSPWRWRLYPAWWRPWHPFAWQVFYPRCLVYHRNCAIVYTHRVVAVHQFYAPYRVSSVMVRTRTEGARNHYSVTHTRVTGPRGNTRVKTTVEKRERGREREKGRGRGRGRGRRD